MGNMLKGLAEMLSQSGNIIDALTNSQAIAGAQPAFDVSKTNILTADNSSSPFSDDNIEVVPRSGAVIGLDGIFRQLEGSSNYYLEDPKEELERGSQKYKDYYLKGPGQVNLICTKSEWSKDNNLLFRYVKALAKHTKSNEIYRLSVGSIGFNHQIPPASTAEVFDFMYAENTPDFSVDGVPSVGYFFKKLEFWKFTIYTSPETLDYFSFKSILVHENRHLEQIKILRKYLFQEQSSDSMTNTDKKYMLVTLFAGMKMASEEDGYDTQAKFIYDNRENIMPEEKINLNLGQKQNDSNLAELKRLKVVLRLREEENLSALHMEQVITSKNYWKTKFREIKYEK
jgi:hypothetical protein